MESSKPSHVRQLFFEEKPVLVAIRRLSRNSDLPDISQLLKTMTLAENELQPTRPENSCRKRKSTAPVKRKTYNIPSVISKYFPSETIVISKNSYGQHVYRGFVFKRKAIVGKYVDEGVFRPLTKQDIEEAKDLKLSI